MIINLFQTRSSFGADYVLSDNANQAIYTANIRLAVAKRSISLIKNNQPLLLAEINIKTYINDITKGLLRGEYHDINIQNPQGDICGSIRYKRVKVFFGGYGYYEINYEGEVFTCYFVGRGKEGMFICIYIGEQQVAMIEKPPLVRDNKDYYKIYTIDNKYNDIISFFCLYYDDIAFSNYTEVVSYKKSISYINTLDKRIKSKYNPQFKELC
ncbi:MAG: hypothetical protein GX660_07760 [Clostridiaceae bacterium]|nr:hypothetical protein [Clostridiaceae bacterium]